ncbi:Swt1 family HEPN domain-containing protein [Nitrospirillum amazonense]|uniref:Swt1 family HEPN domain-containing protein n=1 Tax=Nitrospirillum amazonense TaxID=28077 RepID=UPI002DD43FA5|nr:Swt1 family HEPN domain-containing protein [Nitrospirillum amazonense]MEC4594442.1 Swt1 family HEPN domain-containing protein [Nitrospirillum amazonense]
MNIDTHAALFMMLGQAASRSVANIEDIVPADSLYISPSYDLAPLVPEPVRQSATAAAVYRLFFVFESYLRSLIVEVLSEDSKGWWDKIPQDIKEEVAKLEETEGIKGWMALGSRDKSALMTLPQLLKIIEFNWKGAFDEVIRDKSLIHEARLICHLRNTICHMSTISEEEIDRVRQTMRDWFRVVAP